MDDDNNLMTAKVNAAMDDRALDHVRASLDQPWEMAVASLREAAAFAVYEDTIEVVLERAAQLASELEGDLRREVEAVAAKLARARDNAKARLAQAQA